MSLKKPSKREVAITKLRVAGYHNDRATWTRVYVENRVGYATAKAAFAEGERARLRGIRCECHECKLAQAAGTELHKPDDPPCIGCPRNTKCSDYELCCKKGIYPC